MVEKSFTAHPHSALSLSIQDRQHAPRYALLSHASVTAGRIANRGVLVLVADLHGRWQESAAQRTRLSHSTACWPAMVHRELE